MKKIGVYGSYRELLSLYFFSFMTDLIFVDLSKKRPISIQYGTDASRFVIAL